jgi:hypothetical protein
VSILLFDALVCIAFLCICISCSKVFYDLIRIILDRHTRYNVYDLKAPSSAQTAPFHETQHNKVASLSTGLKLQHNKDFFL